MSAGAWIMFFVGAIGLWGSLIFFVFNYFRAAARERDRSG
jgi:hypothetical protein